MTTTFGTHNGIESTIGLLQEELPRLETQQQTLEKELAAVTERLESVRTALRSLQALSPAPLLPQGTSAEPDTAPEAPLASDPKPAADAAAVAGSKADSKAGSKAEAAPEPAAGRAQSKHAAGERRRKAPVPAPRNVDDSGSGSARKKAVAGRKRTAASTSSAGTAKTQRPSGRGAGKAPAASKPAKKAGVAKRATGLMDGVVECLSKAEGPMRAGEVNRILGREETAGSVNAVRTALERLAKASRVRRVGRGLYQTAAG